MWNLHCNALEAQAGLRTLSEEQQAAGAGIKIQDIVDFVLGRENAALGGKVSVYTARDLQKLYLPLRPAITAT